MSCYFYFALCLLDLSSYRYNVVSLYFLFALCLSCLTVFVNCLVKQFTIFLGVVVILLLNVMEVLSVGEGALLYRSCMVF